MKVAHLALIGVLYFAGAKLGMLSVMPEGNAVFWPANAVTLAALLRFNGARLPAIGLVVLAAEVAADLPRFSLVEALLFGMINFAEAAGAFLLLRRLRFDAGFTAVAHVWKFLVAAIAASGCSALLGAAVYSAFRGADTTYFDFFRIWWFGDAVGLMVVTPLLLGFAPFRTMSFDAPSRWSRVDSAIALVALAAVPAIWMGWAPLLGTLFFVLYVAWRAAPRWAAAAVALAAIFVVLVLASGRQPFGELDEARETMLYAQRFLFVLAIFGLGFSTLLAQLRAQQAELERRVAERTHELEEANARLAELAAFDALSGAANRRNFDQALNAEALRSHRYKRPLAVILADIDRFKNVNDSHGHAAGDDVIRGLAATLAANCRSSDLVARYGGEEFAVLLPETGAEQAAGLAERLRQAIEGADYGVGRITASFGVAELGADGSPTEIVGNADRALYEAKAQGRNRVVLSEKSRHSLPLRGAAE